MYVIGTPYASLILYWCLSEHWHQRPFTYISHQATFNSLYAKSISNTNKSWVIENMFQMSIINLTRNSNPALSWGVQWSTEYQETTPHEFTALLEELHDYQEASQTVCCQIPVWWQLGIVSGPAQLAVIHPAQRLVELWNWAAHHNADMRKSIYRLR